MKNKLNILLTSVLTISLFISCSNDEVAKNSEVFDMSKIEISTEGMQSVIDNFESNSDIKFEGKLVNAQLISVENLSNLKSNVDAESTILLEVLTNEGELLRIYSAPSLDNENEAIVFAEVNGVVTDEIKFNFYENTDGSTDFNAVILTDETGRATSWGSCMQGFFSDPYVGTITQVAGIAGGLGCIPCAGVAGFFTGVAALGCLA